MCRERDEKDMFDKLKPNEFSKFVASKRIVNGEMPSVAAAEKSK